MTEWVLDARGGVRLCLAPRLDSPSTYVLLEQEDWFEDEIRFVRRWLRPGMHAIDVGANVGLYTAAMAAAVGREGRVWAFEPTPGSAELLQRMLELNGFPHVTLRRQAVSSREGEMRLSQGKESELNAIAEEGIAVQATTLDSEARAHGWQRPAFLKIDVEGHELEVVEGGARLLQAASPLVMLEIRAGKSHDLRALKALGAQGYGFYRLLPHLLVLVPFDPDARIDEYQLNVFACKDDRRDELAAAGLLSTSLAAPAEPAEPALWQAYAQGAPYAAAAQWQAPEIMYGYGLAAFAASRDERRTAQARVAWLRQSFECVMHAVTQEDTLARRLSLARVAWELGSRAGGVISLFKAAERVKAEAGRALAEPFICPSPRYEAMRPAGEWGDWLQCAVIEQYEKLRAYSSFFTGGSSANVLAPIEQRAYRSPEMERRRQLVAIRSGAQAGPVPTPLLVERSEENLNPEFWRGT